MTDELEYLRRQICNMSDDELRKMVTLDLADYRLEAIDLAREELKRRNIEEIEEAQIEELRRTRDKDIPTGWLEFYIYCRIPLGIIGALITALLTEAPVFIFFTVLYGTLSVAVFVGLRRRRLWGWKLNWILLAVESLLFPLTSESGLSYFGLLAIVALLWIWPNYVYFRKRRHLFKKRQSAKGDRY